MMPSCEAMLAALQQTRPPARFGSGGVIYVNGQPIRITGWRMTRREAATDLPSLPPSLAAAIRSGTITLTGRYDPPGDPAP